MEHPTGQRAASPHIEKEHGNDNMGLLLAAEVGRDIDVGQGGQSGTPVSHGTVGKAGCEQSTGRFTACQQSIGRFTACQQSTGRFTGC
jgi:hypothetical protein